MSDGIPVFNRWEVRSPEATEALPPIFVQPKLAPGRMTRAGCLDAARAAVLHDRNNIHGEPEDVFAVIAQFWSTYLTMPIRPHDVAAMMALVKLARIKGNPGHPDNYADLCGYSACGAELAPR